MNSYQRRIKERDAALLAVEQLKKELHAKGNVFFQKHTWLGRGKMVFGTFVDGELVVLHEEMVP